MWSQTASSRAYSWQTTKSRQSISSVPKPISDASRRLLLASRAAESPSRKEHRPDHTGSSALASRVNARPLPVDISAGGDGRGALRVISGISNMYSSAEVGESRPSLDRASNAAGGRTLAGGRSRDRTVPWPRMESQAVLSSGYEAGLSELTEARRRSNVFSAAAVARQAQLSSVLSRDQDPSGSTSRVSSSWDGAVPSLHAAATARPRHWLQAASAKGSNPPPSCSPLWRAPPPHRMCTA
jgi:hypothetical protein